MTILTGKEDLRAKGWPDPGRKFKHYLILLLPNIYCSDSSYPKASQNPISHRMGCMKGSQIFQTLTNVSHSVSYCYEGWGWIIISKGIGLSSLYRGVRYLVSMEQRYLFSYRILENKGFTGLLPPLPGLLGHRILLKNRTKCRHFDCYCRSVTLTLMSFEGKFWLKLPKMGTFSQNFPSNAIKISK